MTVDSTSKNTLFSRAKNWAISEYNSQKDALQVDDKEGGMLAYKGYFTNLFECFKSLFLSWYIIFLYSRQFTKMPGAISFRFSFYCHKLSAARGLLSSRVSASKPAFSPLPWHTESRALGQPNVYCWGTPFPGCVLLPTGLWFRTARKRLRGVGS